MDYLDSNISEKLLTPCFGRNLSSDSIFTYPQFNYKEKILENNLKIAEADHKMVIDTEQFSNTNKKEQRKKLNAFSQGMENKRRRTQNKKDYLYICEIGDCKKQYTTNSRLTIHKRTHLGIKPFKCNYCDKAFNEKGNLKIHIRIHTGEKPYKCNYENCTKEFKVYGHLNDHIMAHLNIKPYKCSICKASFSRTSTLKTHHFIHTGEKPFICPQLGCNKRFTEKGNMKMHYKTHLRKNEKYSEFIDFIIDSCKTIPNTVEGFNQNYSCKIVKCASFSILCKIEEKSLLKPLKNNFIIKETMTTLKNRFRFPSPLERKLTDSRYECLNSYTS